MECLASALTLTLGTALTAELSAVRAVALYPQENSLRQKYQTGKRKKQDVEFCSCIPLRHFLRSKSSGTRRRVEYQIATFCGSLLPQSSGSNNLTEISQKVYGRCMLENITSCNFFLQLQNTIFEGALPADGNRYTRRSSKISCSSDGSDCRVCPSSPASP